MKQWMVHRWWGLTALVGVLVFVASVSQRTLLITGTVLGSTVAVGALTFAGIYAWRSLWKSTPAGRALMYTMICLGLFAAQVSAGAWTTLIFHFEHGYPWRLEIRVVIYAAMVVTLVRLIQNLVRIQAGRQL
ncbi:MAG: hypothetical protein INR66_25840 [Gordonia polyisoprenivorans]|nr:hypothetical protein [Gordonia polyisoprenivorans]